MTSVTYKSLKAAGYDSGLAVELSAHIPELLAGAARKSTKLLTQFSSAQASSTAGGSSSSSGPGHRRAASSSDTTTWQQQAQWCSMAIGALQNNSRLPAQLVLERFASSTAAEEHVGWMEDLAGRILQYSQQPGSSSSSRTGSGAVLACVLLGQLPCWEDLAYRLLGMWISMQRLHFQCLLAASSGAGPSTSAGGWFACKESAWTSSVVGKGGTPCVWLAMRGGAESLRSAAILQVQTAWLRPNLLRLQHAWLLRAREQQGSLACDMKDTAQGWALEQRAPYLHPAVVQLGAVGPVVGAAVMQSGSRRLAELQDVAWGYLATGSTALRQHLLPRLLRAPGLSALLHPTLQRCPSYHKGHSYAAVVLTDLQTSDWHGHLPAASEVYLMGCELWDLWPWVLEMLVAGEQQQQAGMSAGFNGDKQPSADADKDAHQTPTSKGPPKQQQQSISSSTGSSSSSSDWRKGSRYTSWPLVPHAIQPLLHGQGSKSSRGGDAGSNTGSCASGGPAASMGGQLPPVSASQLKLVLERVCLNVQLSTYFCNNSLLLLALLLLRADPALRLWFLQGPQGSLLLAALQLYGCGRTPLHDSVEGVESWLAPKGCIGPYSSQGLGMKGLLDAIGHAPACEVTPAAPAAGLALSWLLLQLQDSMGSSCTSSSGSGSHSSSCRSSSSVDWVPGNMISFSQATTGASGGLPLIKVPAAALQLLPGYTPTLQLAATLETLLLQGADPSPLLSAVAASWQQNPSRAPPPESPMWLTLASMAVKLRKWILDIFLKSSANTTQAQHALADHIHALLPLLRLAVTAQQQPGAGWGALALGSAVQGAALACCAAALHKAGDEVTAVAAALQLRDTVWPPAGQLSRRMSKAGVMGVTAAGMSVCTTVAKGCYTLSTPCSANVLPASSAAGVSINTGVHRLKYRARRAAAAAPAAAPAAVLSAWQALTGLAPCPAPTPAAAVTSGQPPTSGTVAFQGAGRIPDLTQEQQQAVTHLHHDLQAMLRLLRSLYSSWPGGHSQDAVAGSSTTPAPIRLNSAAAAAAAARQLAASLSTSSVAGDTKDRAQKVLHHLASCMDVCTAAGASASLCSSHLQLLGCANLGCTTPPAPGLGGCEASLVVNCRGSVCGGCGVVRYCSAACAQQDWPGHRRVCRQLAAVRGCSRCTGG